MKTRYCAALFAAVAMLSSPLGSFAESHKTPGTLARIWTIIPKNGSELKFDKAFADHVQWRRDNKDPWNWDVFVQVDGPEVGAYYARSGNRHWSDFDAYEAAEFSKKAGLHWNETVAPHVAVVRSEIDEYMPDISNWPMDAPEYNLFRLNRHLVNIGGTKDFVAAVGAIGGVLKEAKWPHHWSFHMSHSGEGPSVTLVLPSINWAGIAEPESNVGEVLVKSLGEEKAGQYWANLFATFRKLNVVTVKRIPELAVKAAK
jgi:hypothetical protein